MAKLIQQVLGKPRGKYDGTIYRKSPKGDTIFYKCEKWTAPESENFYNNNSRFSLMNTFTAAVNDMTYIKLIWKSYHNIPGKRVREKIYHINNRHCFYDLLKKSALIVPHGYNIDKDTECLVQGFSCTDDNSEIELVPSLSLIKAYKNPGYLNCLIYLSSPVSNRVGSKVLNPYSFICLEQEFKNLSFTAKKPIKLKFYDDPSKYKDIKYYNRVRIYFSLVFLNSEDKYQATITSCLTFKGEELDDIYFENLKQKERKSQELADIPTETHYKLKQR